MLRPGAHRSDVPVGLPEDHKDLMVVMIFVRFDYDQVVIIARKVGDPDGEHCTTYGVNKEHCAVAARIGDYLKYKVMQWVKVPALNQTSD